MKAFNFRAIISRKLRTKAIWSAKRDEFYDFEAEVAGNRWNITINDFPEEDMFTLYINDKKHVDFNTWPDSYWGELPVDDYEKIIRGKLDSKK